MTARWRRGGGGVVVATIVHALVLVGIAARPAPGADEAAARAKARAGARAERAAILRTAEADVAAGRAALGEIVIRLGHTDRVEEAGGDPATDLADRERALATYRAMLADVRAEIARGASVERAVLHATERDGRAARYKRMYPRLVDALVNGGGNCVALSTLAVALAHDAGGGAVSSFRVYSNHVAPDVGGFRFGMVARCHGDGAKLATGELIAAYARARASNDTEPFAFPKTDDACDDPGDVFGDRQLRADDPPPMPARAPLPPGVKPTPEPETEAQARDCKRRTVLEEYDEDVEVIGADGRTLGGVGVPRLATLDLAGHAKSAACFEGRVAAMDASDPDAFVLALGDAALATEDAARVFAAVGELDVAREYEHRLAAHRAKAAAPLERVIARLSDPDPSVDTTAVLMNAGRLVALGEGGRTAMLLASERHRGFWELANLMTRPSSQVGAIKRWGEKPADVQRDVVSALPCASETFRAQLATVATVEAKAILAACDERMHAIALATARMKRGE